MPPVQLQTIENGTVKLSEEDVATFASGIRGGVLAPGDTGYDDTRAIWNAMIDKRPGLIARCRGVADVRNALQLARDHNLQFSVRGAGHNIAGNSLCEGGLLIALSPMKSVRVDAASRTVRVEPGATLGDLDHETQAFGLAVPTGINSTTGIAGLTLGGGFGWLGRKYGMTIDNLLSADVVTAKGEVVRASETENADLFWGIRGGGGNFGIVTSFEFRCHEVGPEVLAGLVVYSQDDGKKLFDSYRKFAKDSPEELTTWVVMRQAPPLPFLPEEVHGTNVMVFAFLYSGNPKDGEKHVQPLRNFGKPLGEMVGPMPFAGWQTAFDPLLTPGARNYWKTHNFKDLSPDVMALLLQYAGALPTPLSEIFIGQMGGVQARIPAEATAYRGRDAEYVMNVHTRWEDAKDDERCIAWARKFWKEVAPHAMPEAYINFMTADEGTRVPDAYGENFDRLSKLKAKYDPENRFRMNQNIPPAK